MFPTFALVCLLAFCNWRLPLQALDLFESEEVEYLDFNVTVRSGDSVRLDCGVDPPSVFIWGFIKANSDSSVALVYDDGRGPKLQAPLEGVLRVHIPAKTFALVLEEVGQEAKGRYTCQALYREGHMARVTFYSTLLNVEDD